MVAFRRSRGSHLEIDNEEQEASKDVVYPTPNIHPSYSQRELVELFELVVMVCDDVMIRERPT